MPLEVIVNGARSGTWILVERGGQLYAPRDAFEEWRVHRREDVQPIKFKGEDYFPLSAVPGYKSKIDFTNQSVELAFSPDAFSSTRLAQEMYKRPVVSPVLPSAFFNYDINYVDSEFRGAQSTKDLGILSEFGISNRWGVLTSTGVGRNLTDGNSLAPGRSWTRLETTFTRDFPDQNRTLRIGDTHTLAAMSGRDVYFGGVQYGTNFGLTPGYISQPIPVLRGLSAEPSTVELYVNDVLRQVSNVPTGPFTVGNFPVVSGGGEVRVVVRDILGRETVLVQPFFTSTQLLAAGLADWRAEAGSVRLDLGNSSNRYGTGFLSGTWRYGYTDALTLEGRAEAASQVQTLWMGAVRALPLQFLGKAEIVTSHHQSLGGGNQWLLGLERQGLRSSLQLQAQGASIDFRALGQDTTTNPTKFQIAGNWTYSTEKAGTFGMGFAHVNQFTGVSVSTVSANYSIRIAERTNVIVNASHAVAGGSSANSIGVTLVVLMGKNLVGSVVAASNGGQQDLYATATQNPLNDFGFGWRALAGQQQDHSRAEAGSYYTGRYGRVLGEISNTPDQTTVRLGATGGMVLADGRFFATQRVSDSFAVAEVPGYADVGIGLGANRLTSTDASGAALIPRLLAYQNNSIRIDPNELPVSAEIDSIEQVAVPAWRSAVKVVFPVRKGRGALVKIVLDDGDVAPAGAIVQIEGDKEEFYVARRGEAFVTGLQTANRLSLKWKERQCKFELTLPAESPDETTRVGPLLCKGVAR